MTIADLTPDTALTTLLDKQVKVQTSATTSVDVRCYADGKMPNKNLADEFITLMWNGSARSLTRPFGVYRGNLALTIYCKTQTDNTVKTNRVRQMLAQCESIVNNKSIDGFFFQLDATNLITPTTTNLTTGYSATVLNVEWHTIN